MINVRYLIYNGFMKSVQLRDNFSAVKISEGFRIGVRTVFLYDDDKLRVAVRFREINRSFTFFGR